MTPAKWGPAGPKQFDGPQTAWEHFLAFLESVGVDRMKATTADVIIHADAVAGAVTVTEFLRDEKGRLVVMGDDVGTVERTYEFTRETP